MATAELNVGRALATPSTTGSAFKEEQRGHMWRRSRLLFLTGMAIALAAAGINLTVPSADPRLLVTGLFRLEPPWAALSHAASFLLALGALYLARNSARGLQVVAFLTIAFNLVLAIYNQVVRSPTVDPYFEVSLLLFLSAAFIPWVSTFQVGLAGTAVLSFAFLQMALYALVPEAASFWAERGAAAMRDHTAWGTSGIAILGGASVLVSRTLYKLRKAAHHAKRLGNYIIHGELGMGGMGQVYVAQHRLICRPTAVKVMKAEEAGNPASLARFEREVKLSATLTHPNTITIYDVGRTQDGSLYYAMEYLEGLDLQQLVERFGPVPPARTVHILKQVAGSLAEAHSRNIVHRDIKPSNIFLTRRGGVYDFVKVLDFGLAKEIKTDDTATSITKGGILFGTPRYMAPETVYGNDAIDGRADLYNLGGVAYWMLSGQPPFSSSSSLELIVDHVKTEPKRLTDVSELPIPPELEELVLKLLEKKPQDRIQTAEALEATLEALPIAETWSREKAREWWGLHGIVGEDALDCECFFPDELPADEDAALLAVEQPA